MSHAVQSAPAPSTPPAVPPVPLTPSSDLECDGDCDGVDGPGNDEGAGAGVEVTMEGVSAVEDDVLMGDAPSNPGPDRALTTEEEGGGLSNRDIRAALSELASELLRLQGTEATDSAVRRTGPFDPAELRGWSTKIPPGGGGSADGTGTPNPKATGAPTTPVQTPDRRLSHLPTPTSVSDGRSGAADVLRAQIREIQSEYGAFDETNAIATNAEGAAGGSGDNNESIGKIADFFAPVAGGVDVQSQSNTEEYQRLRKESNEARAEAALLRAELVAVRGRHEEEKRRMHRVTEDLRSRNEELEGRMSSLRLDGNWGGGIGGGGGEGVLTRGISEPMAMGGRRRTESGEDVDSRGGAGPAFGSRFKGLFGKRQGWGASPPYQPRPPQPHEECRLSSTLLGDSVDESMRSSLSGSLNPSEDNRDGQINLGGGEDDPPPPHFNEDHRCDPHQQRRNDSAEQISAALEERLRQSDRRADLLEQRLQIVKESGDAVIRSLHEELSDAAEDRARAESSMIKELAGLDSQRRAESEDHGRRTREWMAHEDQRRMEVEDYEKKIESLIRTVQHLDLTRHEGGCDDGGVDAAADASSQEAKLPNPAPAVWEQEAEDEMYGELVRYIDSLQTMSKDHGDDNSFGSRASSRDNPLVRSINETFDREYNADPKKADEMIRYYQTRPELREFTLKSEVPRMDYEVLVTDEVTGEQIKLVSTDQIRSYFASSPGKGDSQDEVDMLLRASNQSLLADPVALLTGEGDAKLVHSGSFHSTVIATVCSFKLDLRHEGQRRVNVRCELAICIPAGEDEYGYVCESGDSDSAPGEDKAEAKRSCTLELARADLGIQFSPSPTSTPSGASVQYRLLGIKPTISDYGEGSDCDRVIRSAAAALARDLHASGGPAAVGVSKGGRSAGARFGDRFLSRARTLSKTFSASKDPLP